MYVFNVVFRSMLIIFLCRIFLATADVYAVGTSFLPDAGKDEDIKHVISIGTDTLEACINQSVKLSYDGDINEKDILAYEWRNKVTGDSVGNTREIIVSPKATTTYQLFIKYILRNDERIKNGDFELGESDCYNAGGSSPWNEVWKCRSFESQYVYVKSNSSTSMHPEGTCKIVQNTRKNHMYFVEIKDHTKKDGTGYLLVANGDPSLTRDRIVWQTTITGVVPGKQYAFSVWAANVGGSNPPMLDFTINKKGLGGTFDSFKPVAGGKWEQRYKIWTADDDHASIALINKTIVRNGNDFTIDDISFAPVVMGIGEVEVKILPQIDLVNLADLKVCEGENLTVKANAIGSNITGYEWIRKNDGVKVSATDRMKIINADVVRDAGEYSCTVTGVCGSKSADFVLTVNEKLRNRGAKVDTLSVCVNENAVLSAARCTGDGLKYSWRAPANNWQKPGTGWLPVTADEVSCRKPSASLSDAGKYRCIVTGQCGKDTVYSVLNVEDAPRLGKVSADTTVCPGAEVRLFATSATKDTDVSWILPDNTVVKGGSLTVWGNEQTTLYRCILEKCGRSLSKSVLVNAFRQLQNVTVSRDTAVCEGGTAILEIQAKGIGLKYSWSRKNPDETSKVVGHAARLVIPGVTEGNAGEYVGTVTDTCGNLSDKKIVRVSLLKEYDGLEITPGRNYCPGDPVKLEVTGGGNGLKYEWLVPAGNKVHGSVVMIDKMDVVNQGKYVCKVSGVCPGINKEVVLGLHQSLNVNPSVYAFRECAGEKIELRADATGVNLSYNWIKNGAVTGSVSNVYTLNSLNDANAGKYECRIHSACGDSVLFYQVDLKQLTRITTHTPDHKYVAENDKGMLYVTATGENNRYVWKQDGKIVGDDNHYLTLPSFVGKPEGDYQFTCEVTGDCGKDAVVINVHLRKFSNVSRDTTIQVCKASGYTFMVTPVLPPCPGTGDTTYRVEYGGNVFSTGPVMPFPAGTKGGLYTWYIKNRCGEMTLRMNIEINDVPVIKGMSCEGAFAQRNDTVYVCSESSVRLAVQAQGGQMFEWSKDGHTLQVGNNPYLSLSSMTAEMEGRYTCRVVNDCGEASRQLTVVVRKKLKIVGNSHIDQKVCTADAVKLSVEVNVDDAEFTWNGPNRANWSAENRGYISYYQNSSVKSETDHGIYVCRAESVCGSEEIKFNVDIEAPIELTAFSPNDSVCKGSDVDLFVRVNVPSVTYTWTMPNGKQSHEAVLKLPFVTEEDAGIYRYHITSRCVVDAEGTVELALFPELSELELSRDTAVCENQPVDFISRIQGARLVYHWRGPSGLTSGKSSVRVPVVGAKNAGIYELSVIDVCGLKRSGSLRLSILKNVMNLKSTPDTMVCEGAPILLEVEHEGLAKYEWWFRGNKIAESRKLVLPGVSARDTGMYICRVKGSCVTMEDTTHVEIYRNLSVTASDSLVRVCTGETVQFGVSAIGDKLQYVWSKAGSEVGYRESHYNIQDVIVPDAGFYRCDIISACENKSVTYELQVKERTRILSHSPDRFVSEHDSVRLVVRASGEGNIFQWAQENKTLTDNENSLFIDDVGSVDTLHFKVIVRGECGEDSARMIIKIGKYKILKETLSPDSLCEGSTYTYVGDMIPSGCYGDEVFSYEWTRNGVRLPFTGPLLRLEDMKPEDSGSYDCRIWSDCGEVIFSWVIYVMKIPEIVSMTEDSFITEGAEHRIDVGASGDRLCYSWRKDGLPYTGNQSFLLFNPVKYEDQGMFRVTVGNVCSSVERESELKVWRKTIVISPDKQEIEACAGTDTVFRVEALGASGLIYKWYHNGILLSVPMINKFSLKGMKTEDSGIYKCIVSGRGGEDSCFVYLNVHPLPQVDIEGNFGMCRNDLSQLYQVQTENNRLLYRWESEGGKVSGRTDLTTVRVAWDGQGDGIVALNATSSETGCSIRIAYPVEYFPLPEVALALPDTVGNCIDSLVLDQGYPWGGYYLVDGIRDNTIRFTDKSKTYTVDYYYADRCSSWASDTVRVEAKPFIKVAESNIITGWCHPAKLGISQYSPGTILWMGDKSLDVKDVLHPVYTAVEYSQEDILFKVELTDKYGCKASDEVVVSLLPSPRVYLGKDTIVGVCRDLVLKADCDTSRFDRIEWSPANQLQPLDSNMARVTDKKEGGNYYTATVIDRFGCRGSDTLLVTVAGSPKSEGREICDKDSVVVDCRIYSMYEWEDGYEGDFRVIKEPGIYVLNVADEFGCTGDFTYHVHRLPQVVLKDTLIFEGQTMEYRLELLPEYEPYRIRWQDGSTGDVLVASKEGTYFVDVKDNTGCSASDSTFLTVRKRAIAAPDAFLPGSSAENARFHLKEVNFVARFEMYIYDRWGELVFKTDQIGFKGGWDGTFKGMDCQPGVYVWVAFADGKEIGRGTVALIK